MTLETFIDLKVLKTNMNEKLLLQYMYNTAWVR